MSANDAKPTGEVKNPDEPYFGDEGVNYDTYADGSSIGGPEKADINFDSADIEKRQKTEYFVNVAGAEKRKREEERLEAKARKRRVGLAKNTDSARENRSNEGEKEIRRIIKSRKSSDRANKIKTVLSQKKFRKGCLIATILIAAIVCCVLAVSFFVKEKKKMDESANFNDSVSEMYDISDGDSADSGENAMEYIDKKISEASSCDVKAEYSLAKAKYLNEKTENVNAAISALDSIDCTIESKRTKSSIYHLYSILYGKTGDQANQKKYKQLYIETLEGMKIGD